MKRIGFQRSQNFELGLVSRDGIAILLPGVAFWLSLVFEISLGNPFWFLFPSAVIASTWFCGKSPGWLTTVISMVVVQYYLTPLLRSFVITRRDLPFSFTFLGCQIFATWDCLQAKTNGGFSASSECRTGQPNGRKGTCGRISPQSEV